jgi:hypothetical protein
MEERSVLRASERAFLSKSAVSHSLARLRELLNDEIVHPFSDWNAADIPRVNNGTVDTGSTANCFHPAFLPPWKRHSKLDEFRN